MRIVILNGPNLNLLGRREPSIYGTKTMEQVLVDIQRAYPDVYLEYHQSNHEGDLIDWVQEASAVSLEGARNASYRSEVKGVILNAGGYTHTSVALRDAVACCDVPVVEVHISDITKREAFRRVSMLTDVCQHTIIGHGIDGYKEAIDWIIKQNTL